MLNDIIGTNGRMHIKYRIWYEIMKVTSLSFYTGLGIMDTILVIDDSLTVQAALKAKLSDLENCSIIAASSGREGIRMARKFKPLLIILDVFMPELNGFETCKLLKSIPTIEHIPVIFHTTESADEDILEGFNAGGSDYIAKTWNHNIQRERIRVHIERVRVKKTLEKTIEKDNALIRELQDALDHPLDYVKSSLKDIIDEYCGSIEEMHSK